MVVNLVEQLFEVVVGQLFPGILVVEPATVLDLLSLKVNVLMLGQVSGVEGHLLAVTVWQIVFGVNVEARVDWQNQLGLFTNLPFSSFLWLSFPSTWPLGTPRSAPLVLTFQQEIFNSTVRAPVYHSATRNFNCHS